MTLGPETLGTLYALAAFSITRAAKAVGIPSAYLPTIAYGSALALSGGMALYHGTDLGAALLAGLVAGSMAIGGKSVLAPAVRKLGPLGARVADVVFGPSSSPPPAGPSVAAALVLAVAMAGGAVACTPGAWARVAEVAGAVLSGATKAQDAITAGQAGAERYFARHPNGDAERTVAERAADAQALLDALRATAAGVKAGAEGDVEGARDRFLPAYRALREALDAAGVLSADAPLGGAEGDAPAPQPVALPTVDELAEAMRAP